MAAFQGHRGEHSVTELALRGTGAGTRLGPDTWVSKSSPTSCRKERDKNADSQAPRGNQKLSSQPDNLRCHQCSRGTKCPIKFWCLQSLPWSQTHLFHLPRGAEALYSRDEMLALKHAYSARTTALQEVALPERWGPESSLPPHRRGSLSLGCRIPKPDLIASHQKGWASRHLQREHQAAG